MSAKFEEKNLNKEKRGIVRINKSSFLSKNSLDSHHFGLNDLAAAMLAAWLVLPLGAAILKQQRTTPPFELANLKRLCT